MVNKLFIDTEHVTLPVSRPNHCIARLPCAHDALTEGYVSKQQQTQYETLFHPANLLRLNHHHRRRRLGDEQVVAPYLGFAELQPPPGFQHPTNGFQLLANAGIEVGDF